VMSLVERAREAAEQREREREQQQQAMEAQWRADREEAALADIAARLGVEAKIVAHVGEVVTLEAEGLTFEWQRPRRSIPGAASNVGELIYLAKDGVRYQINDLAGLGSALGWSPPPAPPPVASSEPRHEGIRPKRGGG
jgi:hypothetical protein